MILTLWFAYALLLIVVGLAIRQPHWLRQFFTPQFYCDKCHINVTNSKKYLANYNSSQELDSRQV